MGPSPTPLPGTGVSGPTSDPSPQHNKPSAQRLQPAHRHSSHLKALESCTVHLPAPLSRTVTTLAAHGSSSPSVPAVEARPHLSAPEQQSHQAMQQHIQLAQRPAVPPKANKLDIRASDTARVRDILLHGWQSGPHALHPTPSIAAAFAEAARHFQASKSPSPEPCSDQHLSLSFTSAILPSPQAAKAPAALLAPAASWPLSQPAAASALPQSTPLLAPAASWPLQNMPQSAAAEGPVPQADAAVQSKHRSSPGQSAIQQVCDVLLVARPTPCM